MAKHTLKNLAVLTPQYFLRYVWPFFSITHGGVKNHQEKIKCYPSYAWQKKKKKKKKKIENTTDSAASGTDN